MSTEKKVCTCLTCKSYDAMVRNGVLARSALAQFKFNAHVFMNKLKKQQAEIVYEKKDYSTEDDGKHDEYMDNQLGVKTI